MTLHSERRFRTIGSLLIYYVTFTIHIILAQCEKEFQEIECIPKFCHVQLSLLVIVRLVR
jgi:hypothetical protein